MASKPFPTNQHSRKPITTFQAPSIDRLHWYLGLPFRNHNSQIVITPGQERCRYLANGFYRGCRVLLEADAKGKFNALPTNVTSYGFGRLRFAANSLCKYSINSSVSWSVRSAFSRVTRSSIFRPPNISGAFPSSTSTSDT